MMAANTVCAARDLGVPTKIHSRDPASLAPTLATLLSRQFPDRAGLEVANIEIPTGAGVNNETLLLDLAWRGGTGGAVLRIDTEDNLFLAPGFEDHFRLYQLMREKGIVPVPEVFGLETDMSVLGRPFFFMERMEGRVPSDQPLFHTAGWVLDASPASRAAMWRDAVAVLARVHHVEAAEVRFLDRPKLGTSGLEQEFNHALDYAEDALRGDRHRIIEQGRDWLRAHFPTDPPTGFAWGDARPQNLMFRDDRVVALFDWDMASLAGPEADLAWWTQMDLSNTVSRDVARLEGWGSPAETIALWERISGRRLRDMHWHFTFAAFRGAVIVMRLAKMLDAKGQLPAQIASWKENSIGVQYLASLIGIEPMSADSRTWPDP